MTVSAATGKCHRCRHFRNDPAYLEAAIKGLSAMSSAWGSVRADDGLCLHHNRYLSAESHCRDFQPEAATADLC